jgi:hypothetical protein
MTQINFRKWPPEGLMCATSALKRNKPQPHGDWGLEVEKIASPGGDAWGTITPSTGLH